MKILKSDKFFVELISEFHGLLQKKQQIIGHSSVFVGTRPDHVLNQLD